MFNNSGEMPKLVKQTSLDGKGPGGKMNRRQRELAERSAMRSAMHLKLPRPTVVKGASPMSDLMWEIPSPRHRRKSNPSSISENVQDAVQQFTMDLNRSNSHPEILHHALNSTEPNGRYAYVF